MNFFIHEGDFPISSSGYAPGLRTKKLTHINLLRKVTRSPKYISVLLCEDSPSGFSRRTCIVLRKKELPERCFKPGVMNAICIRPYNLLFDV